MRYAGLFSLALAGAVTLACGDSTGITVQDLVGDWSATQYRYINAADTTQQVDVISLGASFTLTVVADGTASTLYTNPQGGTSSDSGTLSGDATTLTLSGTPFQAQRSGDVLTLTDRSSAYDFDGDGSSEAATLIIRMQR